MRYQKVWLVLGFCILFILFNRNGITQDTTTVDSESTIKVTTLVDTREVPLNRQVTCSVIIEWTGELKRYLISEVENPVIENLEIVSTSAADRRLSEAGVVKSAKIYEFVLQPKSLGMAYIEHVIVKYVDNETGEAESLITPRLTIKIIDPVPEPGSRSWMLKWLILVALVLVLFLVIFLIWRRNVREKKRKEAEAVKVVPLEDEYLTQLRESINLNSTEININEAFGTLSKITRKYLSQKYSISALESTTDDIISEISQRDVDQSVINNIREILTVSDLAKFAGAGGDRNELDRIYALLEAVLERNLGETKAEEKKL